MDNPNLTPDPNDPGQGGAAPDPAQQTPEPAQQPSAFQSLVAKKGFKNNDEVANSYQEAEANLGRKTNALNKTKQQLEQHGYTVDADGNIAQAGGGQIQQPGIQQPGVQQPGYQQPEVQPVYDPYTGQQITDPLSLKLASLPVGQREAYIFQALSDAREKQQGASFTNDNEVLSKPEAKGFEDDVRKVMQQVPLAQRANKQAWEDALLRVKGMRYDTAMKNQGQQSVEEFINKDVIQTIPGSGGPTGGGVKLTAEQEGTFKFYQQNHPGMFKDKAHFLRACRPDGGR